MQHPLPLVPVETEQTWLVFIGTQALSFNVSITDLARHRQFPTSSCRTNKVTPLAPREQGKQEEEMSKSHSLEAHFLKATSQVSHTVFWGFLLVPFCFAV